MEKDREAEKAARVEASLREREKEVQRTLAVHLRDRDNEREQHKHDEAVHHFNALLADLVCIEEGFLAERFCTNFWPFVGSKFRIKLERGQKTAEKRSQMGFGRSFG